MNIVNEWFKRGEGIGKGNMFFSPDFNIRYSSMNQEWNSNIYCISLSKICPKYYQNFSYMFIKAVLELNEQTPSKLNSINLHIDTNTVSVIYTISIIKDIKDFDYAKFHIYHKLVYEKYSTLFEGYKDSSNYTTEVSMLFGVGELVRSKYVINREGEDTVKLFYRT
jgi:hypothetical protein